MASLGEECSPDTLAFMELAIQQLRRVKFGLYMLYMENGKTISATKFGDAIRFFCLAESNVEHRVDFLTVHALGKLALDSLEVPVG
uniref:Uncharacterized protein n=1 Tax=Fagus sylvatica TaxID=28930 RepID=A0A2N9G3X5_FAGSY